MVQHEELWRVWLVVCDTLCVRLGLGISFGDGGTCFVAKAIEVSNLNRNPRIDYALEHEDGHLIRVFHRHR